MPLPKKVLNAFTAHQVYLVTGLSVHMIDYLAREGYLQPTYYRGRRRGRVRYYSYRDLLVARIVQKLRERGVELRRLKESIQLLSRDATWFPKEKRSFDFLATDGEKLYYPDQKGSFVELTSGLQSVFAFVLDIAKTKDEVRQRLPKDKRERFAIENRPLLYATDRAALRSVADKRSRSSRPR